MKHKICFKCKLLKPLPSFYKHKAMADGHLGKCKECSKKDVKENYYKNHDYYVAYEKSRLDNEYRREARRLYSKKISREIQNKHLREYREKYKEKHLCHQAIRKAIKNGLIKKPLNCVNCGSACRLEGHHEDYSKPLEVIFLCKKCHGLRHRK